MKNQLTTVFFVVMMLILSMIPSTVTATKCFCLTNDGQDTRIGLNRLACKRAGHDFYPDGCYVATTNGCGVPPQGPEINQLRNACKSLGGDWSAGYMNCRC
ncbi:hypothetical protein EC991_008325 [Linnemannia zychae]|nr:hypothetical protein EC991_008325 [Linnemannia zychae]